MRQSIPRLHSVRWKNGGELRVLRTFRDEHSDEAKNVLQEALNSWNSRQIQGYALVIWNDDTGAVTTTQFSSNGVPSAMLPEYVKSTLLLDRAERWTLEGLSEYKP